MVFCGLPGPETMDGEAPPPYHPSASSSTLTVQLQAWYYTAEGRSTALNERLAELFRNYFRDNNLQDWDVPVLVQEGVTDVSLDDKYVPVEVQFRHRTYAYNDPGEHPMSDVRTLFFLSAPQILYRFFIEIHRTPQNLNIFPVGVPKLYVARYKHAYMLNTQGIYEDKFFVPSPDIDAVVQSWLRDALDTIPDVLKILSAIVNIYVLCQRYRNPHNENLNMQGVEEILRDISGEVPEQFEELRAIFDEFIQPHDIEPPGAPDMDLELVLEGVSGFWNRYNNLSTQMESVLRDLRNGQAIGNQDLYELVWNSRDTVLNVSELKKELLTTTKLLNEDYGSELKRYKSTRQGHAAKGATAGIVIIVACCLWNPFGWAAAGAITVGSVAATAMGGVAGGAAGVGVHWSQNDETVTTFKRKMKNVRELWRAIKTLQMYAKEVHEVLGLLFCKQVLGIPLDGTQAAHYRKELLTPLGVANVDEPMSVYDEELIRDRLKRLHESKLNLCNCLTQVLTDARFEIETFQRGA
ncbi:hypothetical protein B0I35DRAFT_447355 [Stachybotrys elegans]|uniref:Uncharacterized protein n=1 Tax=Stachybotrys elegans TaxID=80388 RepID=A0A8K0WIM3_9HYPO|nr:hypothetical protein B0I35DRAFT_447355 [Stachybotrys elegans]